MLRAELLKLSTTAAPKVALAIGATGLILTQLVFVTLIPALASGVIGPGADALGGDLPSLDLASAAGQLSALSPLGTASGAGSIGIAVIAIFLLGVLSGTSDYRFGGIVSTALAQPKRVQILTSKAAATGVVGLAAGVLFAIVSLVALLVTLAFTGNPLLVGGAVIAAVVARGAIAIACLALVGLAVGILARNQLAGVLAMLGLLLLEPIVQSIAQVITGDLPIVSQLLPLSLATSVIGTAPGGLPLPIAFVALIGLTGVALALAAVALRRQDI
jgi:ABC-2 type transport system permease protein